MSTPLHSKCVGSGSGKASPRKAVMTKRTNHGQRHSPRRPKAVRRRIDVDCCTPRLSSPVTARRNCRRTRISRAETPTIHSAVVTVNERRQILEFVEGRCCGSAHDTVAANDANDRNCPVDHMILPIRNRSANDPRSTLFSSLTEQQLRLRLTQRRSAAGSTHACRTRNGGSGRDARNAAIAANVQVRDGIARQLGR